MGIDKPNNPIPTENPTVPSDFPGKVLPAGHEAYIDVTSLYSFVCRSRASS